MVVVFEGDFGKGRRERSYDKGFYFIWAFCSAVARAETPLIASDRRKSENDALRFACVWSSVITWLMLPVQPPAKFGRKHVGNARSWRK